LRAFSFAYGAGFQPWALSSALILWTNENLKTLSAETDSFMPRDFRSGGDPEDERQAKQGLSPSA